MAGTEIANAYISITTRMPGVKGSIQSALGASDVQSVADKSGRSLGGSLMKGMKVAAVAGAAVVAAGVVATLGAAFTKGFNRLNQLDVATAKLRGLGHDAGTVQTIMDNALSSVRGTSHGLGEAAGVAAQAVAAGIKPGKELESVLSTVANTSSAAGTSMEEMGGIFAKAATQANGVQNDVISQLADRGIPIYQALADQLGVTAGEVFNLASSGKINFEQFAAAATKASGTVAAEMGGTVQGSMANLGASLGRIGAGFLGGTFGQLAPTLQSITGALEPLEGVAEKVGEQVGKFLAPAFEWFRNVLDSGFDFGKFANLASYFSPLGLVFKALQPVLPTLGKALGDIGAILMDMVQKIMPVLLPIFQALVGVLTEVFKAIVPIVQQVISALAPAFKALAPAVVAIFKALQPLIDILVAILVPIIQVLANVIQAVLTPVLGILTGAIEVVANVITWLAENTFPMLVAAGQWLASVFTPIFEGIGAVFTWIYESIISPMVTNIVNHFRFWMAVVNLLWTQVIQPVFQQIGVIFQWIWNTIISPIVNAIGAGIKILGDIFSWLYNTIVRPVWEGISNAISTAWKWIDTNVFNPFKTVIKSIGTAFENVAKAIGVAWDGIKKAAAAPINFVIGTVWNDGILKFTNSVFDVLGLKDMKLKKASLIKFASGGVLPGYTPGRDVHMFSSPTGGQLALSGGEAIMRPEFTRAVGGPAGVARLNSMARNGQAFADGGVWGALGSFAGDVWDNITGAASVAWDFITSPAEAIKKHLIDGIIGPLMGGGNAWADIATGIPTMLVKNMSKVFENAQPTGAGTAGMGWQAMWQIVQNAIPGVVKTSDYRPGSMTVNGGKSYHGSGRAIDLVPASMDTFNQVARLFPNASELIYSPAGNRQLLNGKPFNGWSDAVRRQHYNHVHLAMANGGVVPKLYDQGGWLPSGGMAVNKSGKPEAVLTPAQSEALVNGGFPRELVIVDADRQLIGRMQVEADARISVFSDGELRASRRLR